MRKFILGAMTLVVSLSAANVYEIDPGDIYYINSGLFGEDRRVIVSRVNTDTKRVKVRTSNGDTEWVNASELLTNQENEDKNSNMAWGTAIISGMLLMEAVSEE